MMSMCGKHNLSSFLPFFENRLNLKKLVQTMFQLLKRNVPLNIAVLIGSEEIDGLGGGSVFRGCDGRSQKSEQCDQADTPESDQPDTESRIKTEGPGWQV
ncbi:MAG: hypothetical protein C7B44_15165 [Sulfobacillus thermosulfidooxidans]|nr:MAG: hypothetical protein C7B44_15165 [Sulfobacillus thermosulfidooxidans]